MNWMEMNDILIESVGRNSTEILNVFMRLLYFDELVFFSSSLEDYNAWSH